MSAQTPEWVSRLIRAVNALLPQTFVGKVEVNCVNGHVGNVVVNQSYKEGDST